MGGLNPAEILSAKTADVISPANYKTSGYKNKTNDRKQILTYK